MTMILGFLVMLSLVIIMAVGVLLGRKPLSGSCGGLSALGMKQDCPICGGTDGMKSDKKLAEQANFYDATQKGDN